MDITGTNRNDSLTGTNSNDKIFGLGGDDSIAGRDGNDNTPTLQLPSCLVSSVQPLGDKLSHVKLR